MIQHIIQLLDIIPVITGCRDRGQFPILICVYIDANEV